MALASILLIASCAPALAAAPPVPPSWGGTGDLPRDTTPRPPTFTDRVKDLAGKATDAAKGLTDGSSSTGDPSGSGAATPGGANSGWIILLGLAIALVGYLALRFRGDRLWQAGIGGLLLAAGSVVALWAIGFPKGLHMHPFQGVPWYHWVTLAWAVAVLAAWLLTSLIPSGIDDVVVWVGLLAMFLLAKAAPGPFTPSWWLLALLATAAWRLLWGAKEIPLALRITGVLAGEILLLATA